MEESSCHSIPLVEHQQKLFPWNYDNSKSFIKENENVICSNSTVKILDQLFTKEYGATEIKSQTELPKLYTRKFNGKSFKCSSSHDNSHFAVGFHQLNEIDKFRYLQSCFKGSAQRAINFLPTQDLSYQKVLAKYLDI